MWSVNDSVKFQAKPICVLDWWQCNHSIKINYSYLANVAFLQSQKLSELGLNSKFKEKLILQILARGLYSEMKVQ